MLYILRNQSTKKIYSYIKNGFRSKYNTTRQTHKFSDKIQISLEKKQFYPEILDIPQAFDRVLHDYLLFKLKMFLSLLCYLIIKSFLKSKLFSVHIKNTNEVSYSKKNGIPQRSSPVLWLFTLQIYLRQTTHYFYLPLIHDTTI